MHNLHPAGRALTSDGSEWWPMRIYFLSSSVSRDESGQHGVCLNWQCVSLFQREYIDDTQASGLDA